MDINKILFEQLNLQGIQTPFTADEINGSDAVQSESAQENYELKEEISSALNAQDEASSLQLSDKKESTKTNKTTNNFLSNMLNTQSLMNLLSNETQKYSNEEKEIEAQIQSKTEEYQKLAQEIEEKQEEYEKLVSEAQDSNDESVISNVNSLGEEINSMVGDLESIKTNINSLETTLSSKQKITNTFNSQLNSLSKVQSALNKEAIKESAAVNSVIAADAVQNVNGANETAQSQTTTPARQKVEIKSMEEYKEILDGKFNELWEKFGDKDEIEQYVKNNMLKIADITDDGRIDKIDLQILDNYCNTLPKISSSDPVFQEKGVEYVAGIQKFAKDIRLKVNQLTMTNDNNLYDFSDLENYAKLGGQVRSLRNKLDITAIAQDDNWRERLLDLGYEASQLKTNGDLYKKIIFAQEFIKNNPQNAGYASIASEYQTYISKDFKAQAEKDLEFKNELYQRYLSDPSYYNEYKKEFPYAQVTKEEFAYDKAYSRSIHLDNNDPSNDINVRTNDLKYLDKKFAIERLAANFTTDINSDGKIDMCDVAAFNCDIDLDGDGIVCESEKQFLSDLKEELTLRLYRYTNSKGIENLNTIDDVINTITICDDEYSDNLLKSVQENIITTTEESCNGRNEMQVKKYGKIEREWTVEDSTFDPKGAGTSGYSYAVTGLSVSQLVKGYADGSKNMDIDSKTYHIKDLQDYVAECAEFAKSENSYLHYINSANLSKEELEEILDKINSASEKVQSKLSKVKTLIEQKLSNM